MTSPQKTALSLLIAVIAFSAFSILAFSGLFDYIETNFYDPRVTETVERRLSAGAENADRFHSHNRDRFDAILSESAFRNVFRVNQNVSDINSRDRLVGLLREEMSAFSGLRFVDLARERLWFSTYEQDIVSRTATSREYSPLSEVSAPVPPQDLGLEEGVDFAYRFEPELNQFIYRFLIYDEFDIARGTALVYVNAQGLSTSLVRAGTLGPGEEVRVVDERSVLLNAMDTHARESVELLSELQWTSPQRGRPNPVVELGSEGFVVFRLIGEFGEYLWLAPERNFVMSEGMRWTLLGAAFVTMFLVGFLLLNLRQDPTTVLSHRVKRFQIDLLREYIENKDQLDWDRWKGEIERRRSDVDKEIKRGIGRIKKHDEEQVDALLDKSWEEIFQVIGGSRRQPSIESKIDFGRLEEMIERVVAGFQAGQVPGAASTPGNGGGAGGVAASENRRSEEPEELVEEPEELVEEPEEPEEELEELEEEPEELVEEPEEPEEEPEELEEELEELEEEPEEPEEELEELEDEPEELEDEPEELEEELEELVEEPEELEEELEELVEEPEELEEELEELVEEPEELEEEPEELAEEPEELEDEPEELEEELEELVEEPEESAAEFEVVEDTDTTEKEPVGDLKAELENVQEDWELGSPKNSVTESNVVWPLEAPEDVEVSDDEDEAEPPELLDEFPAFGVSRPEDADPKEEIRPLEADDAIEKLEPEEEALEVLEEVEDSDDEEAAEIEPIEPSFGLIDYGPSLVRRVTTESEQKRRQSESASPAEEQHTEPAREDASMIAPVEQPASVEEVETIEDDSSVEATSATEPSGLPQIENCHVLTIESFLESVKSAGAHVAVRVENEDGVPRIDAAMYENQVETDSGIQELVDSIISGADPDADSSATEETSIAGIDSLFDGPDLGWDFAETSKTAEKQSASRTSGANSKKRSALLISEEGVLYDLHAAGYRNSDSGMVKSLIAFTRIWRAQFGALLLPYDDGLHVQYSLGIPGEDTGLFVIPTTSEFSSKVLNQRLVALLRGPLGEHQKLIGFQGEAAFSTGQTLFLPIKFRALSGYALLGLRHAAQNIEAVVDRANLDAIQVHAK